MSKLCNSMHGRSRFWLHCIMCTSPNCVVPCNVCTVDLVHFCSWTGELAADTAPQKTARKRKRDCLKEMSAKTEMI